MFNTRKGEDLFVADTLSRAALSDGPESPSGMTQEYDVIRVDLTQMDLSPKGITTGIPILTSTATDVS